MEPSAAAAGFGHLFSWRHPATLDLNHAAYRYNQNMMEYYTCKSKFFSMQNVTNSTNIYPHIGAEFFLKFTPYELCF